MVRTEVNQYNEGLFQNNAGEMVPWNQLSKAEQRLKGSARSVAKTVRQEQKWDADPYAVHEPSLLSRAVKGFKVLPARFSRGKAQKSVLPKAA